MNDTVVQLVADDLPAAVDLHQARLHQPIDPRVQAAESGRQLRGKHVHRALWKVDRCAALVGLFVERAPFGHVVRHVGNVYPKPVVAVRQLLERDGIVEIACMFAVDGDRDERPEVGPSFQIALANLAAQTFGFRYGRLAVLIGYSELTDDDLGVDTRLVDGAENVSDAAQGRPGGSRPSSDFHRHHVTGLGVLLLTRWNLDVHNQPAVERHDEAHPALVDVETPDGCRRTPFQDAKDSALRATVRDTLDAGDHAIAVHGLVQIAAGNVDVAGDVLNRAVGHDETEPARIGRDPSDHQVHQVGYAVAVAARLDQGARRDQVFQEALERRPLLARHLQPLQ